MSTVGNGPPDNNGGLPNINWREQPSTPEEAAQKEFEKDNGLLTPPDIRPDAFYGVLAPLVKLACHNTEAVPATVAMHLLTRFGAVIGRSAHIKIGNETRYLNSNSLFVGPTSKGRKGTSAQLPALLFRMAEMGWAPLRELTALSTGEGLINQVRDPRYSDDGEKVIDKGVTDKRLLCDISEFGGALTAAARKDNTLSAVVRDAFDGRYLTTPSKTSYQAATGAHVSIIGSVPEADLIKGLSNTEIANGFANRFGMFYSARTKLIANPTPAPVDALAEWASYLHNAIGMAASRGAVEMDEDAAQFWEEIYIELNDRTHEPAIEKLLGREELYTRLWATQIALFNQEHVVTRAHLLAGLAWRDYWEDTLKFVFSNTERTNQAEGKRYVMDQIVAAVAALGGKHVSHADLTKRLTNNYAKNHPIQRAHVKEALEALLRESPPRIVAERLTTGMKGRPANAYSLEYYARRS